MTVIHKNEVRTFEHLLIGGGVVMVLTIVAVGVLWWFTRPSAVVPSVAPVAVERVAPKVQWQFLGDGENITTKSAFRRLKRLAPSIDPATVITGRPNPFEPIAASAPVVSSAR